MIKRVTTFLVCCAMNIISFAAPVVVTESHGFITIEFPLVETKTFEYPDKVVDITYIFGGELRGKKVALAAIVLMDWEEDKPKDHPFSFWWSAARLDSVGSMSDALVKELGDIFKINNPTALARERLVFKVVSIAKKPNQTVTEIKLKAFVETENKEDYAEFFFNVDSKKKIVTISEKDPEYRKALYRALTK